MIGKYEVTQNEYKSIIGTNPNKNFCEYIYFGLFTGLKAMLS